VRHGTFRCACCQREWEDELPPLWLGMELWPMCCEIYAELVEVVLKLGV